MLEFSYKITNPAGLHARIVAELQKVAQNYQSMIILSKGTKSVDATKVLALMGLGAVRGDEIRLTVEGKDEEQAAEAIVKFIKENL